MQNPPIKQSVFTQAQPEISNLPPTTSPILSWAYLRAQYHRLSQQKDLAQRLLTHTVILSFIIALVWAGDVSLAPQQLTAPRYNVPERPVTVESNNVVVPNFSQPLQLSGGLQNNQSDVLAPVAVPRTIIPDRTVVQEAPLAIRTYEVQSGDTVYDIAARFGLAPETILWSNRTLEDNADLLSVGQELTILPVDGVYHQVGSSDTLAGIASTYKVDVENIMTYPLNEIDPESPTIYAGQWVIVPGGIKPYTPRYVSVAAANAPSGVQGGTGSFSWPASGSVTQGYWSRHRGLDVAAWAGAPVYASDAGYVTTAQWDDSGYGRVVIIDHGNGYKTLYAHLKSYYVQAGQEVATGQQIGEMGSSGNSTGPHLHFELLDNGVQRNPWGFLP